MKQMDDEQGLIEAFERCYNVQQEYIRKYEMNHREMKKTKIYVTILYTLEYEHDETVKQVMDMFEQEEWGRYGVDGICQGIKASDGKMYPFFFDYEMVCAITVGDLCNSTDEITEELFE